MARAPADLGKGPRITDYISLGVLAKTFPRERIDAALTATKRASQRERDLPAHVVVYYVIALALYMQVSYKEVLRCLLEAVQWLVAGGRAVKVTGKSGISQARTRLGWQTMQQLQDAIVRPIAGPTTRGAWYREWRVLSLDGSTLDVADTRENAEAFGRAGTKRGTAACPQLRFVALVETGTHVLLGGRHGTYHDSETTLAADVIPHLGPGMLCLADRLFFGYKLWKQAVATGAELVWRGKKNLVLPCEERLPDGSYRSTVYANHKDRRQRTNGLPVRVIEYTLEGVPQAEPLYRVITTILDPERAPAPELAALYHERWEIETAFDELKTHLRGARIVLRSKTPALVWQEFYGLMLAHFAVRGLMHEAALKVDTDPDTLSFVHAIRVIRRKLPLAGALPPSAHGGVS